MLIIEIAVGVFIGLGIFRILFGKNEVVVRPEKNPWENYWYEGKDTDLHGNHID